MTDYKNQLIAEMLEVLCAEDEVVAIWEGGSVATGFADEYSDLDLTIVTRNKAGNQIFALLDQLFKKHHGIKRKFRVPEPCWHGMSQCAYLLEDSPSLFYCDLCTVELDNPHKLTESDRHGFARIVYDPQGIFKAGLTPAEELERIARRVWQLTTGMDFVLQIELQKALSRGIKTDIINCYNGFIMRCLIPLLNLLHRPHKADFGLRYIHRDYPSQVLQQVEEMLDFGSLEGIIDRSKKLIGLYQETKTKLSARYG